MTRLSEEELIAKVFAPLAGEGAFNLTDDAAVLCCLPDQEIVTTTDTIVAGTHFFPDASPEEVAAKALRTNLSDLVAKGAKPLGYLLALTLPANWANEWLQAFATQLKKDQQRYGISLLGGDTTKTDGPLVITITAFGTVPKGKTVKRGGARPGDIVAVTGTIGDAALGLKFIGSITPNLAAPDRDYLLQRYRFPEPRTAFAGLLCTYASAAIDVSDGLAGDLAKLCRASGVSAKIDLEKVPYSQAARGLITKDESWREVALTGGDDYELLFTLPSAIWPNIQAQAQQINVQANPIGEVTEGSKPPLFLLNGTARHFARGAFQHF